MTNPNKFLASHTLGLLDWAREAAPRSNKGWAVARQPSTRWDHFSPSFSAPSFS
jgi:hypothetical protein